MDLDPQLTFMVGSFLVAIGAVILTGAIIIINNLFARFWKPVQFRIFDALDPRYAGYAEHEPVLQQPQTEPVKNESRTA